MYAYKNDEEDRLFISRSLSLKQMSPEQVMKSLGISEKFIIQNNLRFTSVRQSNAGDFLSNSLRTGPAEEHKLVFNRASELMDEDTSQLSFIKDDKVPYLESIRALERI